jgi:PAS domain S-box-containing protein
MAATVGLVMKTKTASTNGAPETRQPLALLANGVVKGPVDSVKANILLVDDRPDKLLALEAVLSGLEQNLVQARSGKEALRRLLEQDFAVILLDVSMPGMDGFETAALIRQRPRTEHTPIIFVTSIGTTENHMSRGYSLGAVDYLLTPIMPDVLRSKVSAFVELHRQTELGKRQAERLRVLEESRHKRELAEVADRLEVETRRNRFFTLALDILGIAGFDGRLLQVNPAWGRVLGYADEELRRLSGLDLIHPEDRPVMEQRMEDLKRGESISHFEGRYRHKNGSYRWLQWSATPFLAEQLIYIFARDITARKQAEAQVEELNHELEKRVAALTDANHELEAFNYSIAHDLRTPLRSMSGFAKALVEDESASMSPLGLDYARRINHSAKFMDALLLDLLTYSRLARTEMPPVLLRLEEPITEILGVMEKEISDTRAEIRVLSPLGEVFAHPPTLKQIVANLISNSLKFTSPDRKPQLRVFSTREGEFVRLWVEDNGIGVPEEHYEKIFGLFQRLHDAHAYPGTGIGLALVRKGAERMGGRAGVESQPGQGSRFWVDLPATTTSRDGE